MPRFFLSIILFSFLATSAQAQNLPCTALSAHIDSLQEVNSEAAALAIIGRALKFNEQDDCTDSLQLKLVLALTDVYYNLGRFTEILELTDSTYQHKFKLKSGTYLLKLLSIRASTLSNVFKYQEAIRTVNKALALSVELDSVSYFQMLANKGVMLNTSGRYSEALTIYSQTLQHFKQTNQRLPTAITYNNIGEIYRDRFKDYKRALAMYKNAAIINKAEQNTFHLAKNYNNLGMSFSAINENDSALIYLKKSIELNQEMGNGIGLIKARHNLGDFYQKIGKLDKAEEYYRINLKLSNELGFKPGIYYCYSGLAGVQTVKGDYKKSFEYMNIGDSLLLGSEKSMEMEDAFVKNTIANLKGLGKFEEAIAMLEAYNSAKDSVNSFENEQNVLMLRAEYEEELDMLEKQRMVDAHNSTKLVLKKERVRNSLYLSFAIVVVFLLAASVVFYFQKQKAYSKQQKLVKTINIQNDALEKAQTQLSVQLEMNNKILSVLGHDLRAPFASIAGLLGAMNQDALTMEEVQPLTKQLSLEVEQTLTSLSNILSWSRLQLDESGILKEKFLLCTLMESAISYVRPAADAKGISIVGEWNREAELVADPNQMRSILNNLLNNAIKFSEKDSVVEINYALENNIHILKVADNGIGLSAKAADSLNTNNNYSSQGTAGEKGTGIGLSLVRDFIALHNGELSYYNNEPKGTVVEIRIPT